MLPVLDIRRRANTKSGRSQAQPGSDKPAPVSGFMHVRVYRFPYFCTYTRVPFPTPPETQRPKTYVGKHGCPPPGDATKTELENETNVSGRLTSAYIPADQNPGPLRASTPAVTSVYTPVLSRTTLNATLHVQLRWHRFSVVIQGRLLSRRR